MLLKASQDGGLESTERLSLLYLTNKLLVLEENQLESINKAQVDLVLGALFRTYSEAWDSFGVILAGVGQTILHEPEEAKEMADARRSLVNFLSEISARPEFAERYVMSMQPLKIVRKLEEIMISPLASVSQVACLMLGNLARDDDICIKMVRDLKIHEAASMVLRDTVDVGTLHAVLGLLRNLAVPKDNKDSLAIVGVIESLGKCWSMDVNPEIQSAAASLIRQLVNGSIANIKRLLSMSIALKDDTGSIQTQLTILMNLYKSSDQLPIRMEIARTTVAIIRTLHGKEIDEKTRKMLLQDFYAQHTDLEIPLIDMITQTQHPVVRSEGWFALGLMSKDGPGRGLISQHVSEPELMNLLRDTILETTPSTPQPESEGTAIRSLQSGPLNGTKDTKDRENAMVVVYELTKFEVSSSTILCKNLYTTD